MIDTNQRLAGLGNARWLVLTSLLLAACNDDGPSEDPSAFGDTGRAGEQSDGSLSSDTSAPDRLERTADAEPTDPDVEPPAPDAGLPDPDAEPPEPDATTCPLPDPESGEAIVGRLYLDPAGNDQSAYAGTPDEAIDTPLDEAAVDLMSADDEQETTTCPNGRFGFDELDPGAYVIAPRLPPDHRCARRNCAPRFVSGIRQQMLKIVTIGDSIPVMGEQPRFPERLVTLLEPLATVDNVNVAVGGSRSPHWLPDSEFFARRLAPNLIDADVIIISLGGNDILEYASDPALLGDLPAAVAGAHALLLEIIENVMEIVAEIQKRNREVDIVYCLYLDYGQARANRLWGIVNRLFGEGEIHEIIAAARSTIPPNTRLYRDLILADMFEASQAYSVDDMLYDALHLNAQGHTFYAEEIFKALGGVLLGPNPLGEYGRTPLGASRIWSFTVEEGTGDTP